MRKYVIAKYIRLSLEDSKTESLSIQNQRIALSQHIDTLVEADNAEILEFVDNGYSGTNFERPGVQELLELVRGYKVDCIIVKDFSRFGRNSIETGYFIEQVFPLFRTRFISVNDFFDTINYKEDTGGMEVAFKYLISEYYSQDLSLKSKSAKYSKMKRGEYQSKICSYGYKKGSNNRLEIDDEAAQTVKMIFDMVLERKTIQQIIQALYIKGIPTPGEYKASKGCRTHDVSRCHHIWQRSTILRLLADERYVGTYIMGKRTVKELGGNKSRLKDESEWFKIPDHHPAIVDKAVYEQVQAQLRHFRSDKKSSNEYPLRSKVFCGCCQHALIRHKRKQSVFLCSHSHIDDSFECHGLRIYESELESLLFDVISKQAAVILNFDDLSNIGELDLQLTKKAEYERMIQDCQDHKRHLYEQYLLREIDLNGYKGQKEVCDTELNNLNQIYSALSSQTTQMHMDTASKSNMLKIARNVSSESTLTKGLADTLIDRVYVYPDNHIEIVWNIKDFCV